MIRVGVEFMRYCFLPRGLTRVRPITVCFLTLSRRINVLKHSLAIIRISSSLETVAVSLIHSLSHVGLY